MTCACGAAWRVETFDLLDGQVNRALNVIELEVQRVLNGPATATFRCHVRDVPVTDVWPRLRGIGVTWYGRPIWVGFVETIRAASSGSFEIAAVSLDGYLGRRVLTSNVNFQNDSLCEIGVALVGLATDPADGPAPPLTAAAPDPSSCATGDRSYDAEDRPPIGDLVNNLVVSPNRPDYRFVPIRAGGKWSARMDFVDVLRRPQRRPLRSNVHADRWGLDVDGIDVANWINAQSDDREGVAVGIPPGWVRWDAAPRFGSGVSVPRLEEIAADYLELTDGPAATPSVDIPGDLYELDVEPGDRLERLVLQQPDGLCYDGPALVLGVTWRASPDEPDRRTLTLFTERDDVEDAIFDAQCVDDCAEC